MKKVFVFITLIFIISAVYATEPLNKETHDFIKEKFKTIHWEKGECSKKTIKKLSLKKQTICNVKQYFEDGNSLKFIENSRKFGVENLARIDNYIDFFQMFCVYYFYLIADATQKNPKEGLTLLFDIAKYTDGYIATNIQGIIALLFEKRPRLMIKNISLIKELLEKQKNFPGLDDKLCVDKKYFFLFKYLNKSDGKQLLTFKYVMSRICYNFNNDIKGIDYLNTINNSK